MVLRAGGMIVRGLAFALAVLPALPADAASCRARVLVGEVTHVRDGDTIEVAGLPIRLSGLAAPELGTRSGRGHARAG